MNAFTPTAPAITERAMLVALHIAKWSGSASDKDTAAETMERHGAAPEYGRFIKRLVPKGALSRVNAATNTARKFHVANTLPWSDAGMRILPVTGWDAYRDGMAAARTDFDAAVQEFAASYADAVAEARVQLGSLFIASEYPAPEKIEASFSWDIEITPIPTGQDFRVTMSDGEASRVRAEIEARVQAGMEAASRDLWARVRDVVERLASRCKDDSEKITMRSEIVNSVRDAAALMERLNVTGNPSMEATRQRILSELGRHDADALRADVALRAQVAHSADSILASMAGYTS